MGTRSRVDTSPVAQGCPRGLKLRVQYENHTQWKDGAYAWVRQMRDEGDKHSREKLGGWLGPAE